ncbi:MAG: sigma-54 interaction domain-containing protein [Desulfotomaculales bacterium]
MLRLITGAGTEGVSDWEVGIRTPGGGNRCLITCRPVRKAGGEAFGVVVILKETGRVKRVVQRMAGARAYYTFEQIVGRNARFRQTVELARMAAESPSNILLVGESGTGKELFAQAIHNASVRRSGPFVALNCAAVPRELIASELFGYAEGAFTGARKGGNPGKFELADGGTIFLDEIGEMPPELQAVLLRVLEERSVVRVGGNEVIPVDVRVIAATNTDLRAAVERGTFRKDLFYRLNVITIEMIPLRERKDDLPLLCRAFLSRANARLGKNLQGFDPAVERLFAEYAWPGNVRELSNVIEYAANLSRGPTITVEDLPVQFRRGDGEGPREAGLAGSLVDFERSLISATLARHAGNKTRAARDLGIARSTLYRKLKKKPLQG